MQGVAVLYVVLASFLHSGFLFHNDTGSDNPTDSRRNESSLPSYMLETLPVSEESDSINSLPNILLYSDSFNGANDTNALKARNYKVYYRGTGPQGLTATWFQGSSIVFPALNGPNTGYVAANFNAVTSSNIIDNWLVLPAFSTVIGDSLYFYSRSILNSRFPDSIRVMYSQAGDSVPEAAWTELGRFKVSTSGQWQKKGFRAIASGVKARFAIRYNVVNGGPSGVNSDYIGIDSLTLERPVIFPNNMQAVKITYPAGSIPAGTIPVAPKGIFANIGSNSLSNVNVSISVTGPFNYSSTRNISFLNSGDTASVTFDSTFIPLVGTYSVKMYSSLTNDTNRLNDTIAASFTAQETNFGYSGGYFFANSISSGAPSKPEYCWKDTTGSVSLILNGTVVRPELLTGNSDNGYFRLGNIFMPGRFMIFGNEYDSIFIGTNGIIGFTQQFSNLAGQNPDTSSFIWPAVLPLWADFNFGSLNVPVNRLSYKIIGNSFVLISYDRAALKNGSFGDYVSYQVLIDIMDEYTTSNSRILIQYSDTLLGRTGSSFMNRYLAGTLPDHLAGLAIDQNQKCFYRYSKNGAVSFGGQLFSSSPVALQFGPSPAKLNHSCSTATLQLNASIEAITPDGFPSSNSSDSLIVRLREQTSPFEPADAVKIILSNSGLASVNFRSVKPGNSYYIVLEHRNSIETWSSVPLNIPTPGANVSYNFTSNINNAYGSNQTLVSGAACIYSGDVNSDYSIDGTDLSMVDNDAAFFISGYVGTDVNNDEIVDGTDALLVDNNASNFVGMIRP